jgi:hypothetical protein
MTDLTIKVSQEDWDAAWRIAEKMDHPGFPVVSADGVLKASFTIGFAEMCRIWNEEEKEKQ